MAGLTVALVLVPQAMAYAQLAGMPAEYGLYAAFIPPIIAALWGWSNHLSTGPVALSALIAATVVSEYVAVNPGASYINTAILLCLICGVLRLLAGLLRMAFLVNFISEPVIKGFTCAGALIIATSQLGKIFNLPADIFKTENGQGKNFFASIYAVVENIGTFNLQTLLVGMATVFCILLCRKISRKIPSALISLLIAGLVVSFFELSNVQCVANITIKESFFSAPVMLHDYKAIIALLPGALMVVFIGFMEVTSITKAIAARSRQDVNLNQELIGQGLASIAGGFSNSFPVSASFSRSALCYANGGKSGLTTVFAGLCVFGTMLWLTPYLQFIPLAALSAIIIVAVLNLFDYKALLHAWRVSLADGFAASFTFLATLYLAPDLVQGILIGALLAVLLYLFKTMKPRACLVELHDDGSFKNADTHRLDIDFFLPKLRFDGSLYFANAAYFENKILEITRRCEEAKYILVMAEGINDIDASGEYMLSSLAENLKKSEVQLVFVGLKSEVFEILQRSGFVEQTGEENFFTQLDNAKRALRGRGAVQ